MVTSSLRSTVLWCLVFCYVGSSLGQETYLTGVTVVQPAPACPVFVTAVDKHSPAYKAGVFPGDRLVSIDGFAVSKIADAKRLRAASPESVILEVMRRGEIKRLKVARESQSTLMKKRHLHLIDGEWFPRNMTKQDVQYRKQVESALGDRDNMIGIAFSSDHYPKDLTAYYPGFEVFITKSMGSVVGGIENGPAFRAGIRSGDILISIDGTSISTPTPEALEHLLSSRGPRRLSLCVERISRTRCVRMTLERADRVLARSGWQVLHGSKFPASIRPIDLNCAFPPSVDP